MSSLAPQFWLTEKNVRDLSVKHFSTDCTRCKDERNLSLVIFRGEEFGGCLMSPSDFLKVTAKDRHLLSQPPFSYVVIV